MTETFQTDIKTEITPCIWNGGTIIDIKVSKEPYPIKGQVIVPISWTLSTDQMKQVLIYAWVRRLEGCYSTKFFLGEGNFENFLSEIYSVSIEDTL